MRHRRIGPIGAKTLSAAALLAGAAALPAWAQDSTISVVISTQGASVQVDLDCAVTQNGVERREYRQGIAPMRLAFEASALACTVNAAGAVTVEAQNADGSSVSRIQTSGGQLYLNLSSG